jgi:TP901 family phage tail tape measure protein
MAQELDVVLRLRDEATGKLGDVNRQMKAVGTQMAVVGAAGTAAFGLAARGAAGFEAEMTKVVTLVGVNREQVDEWADDIKNLARKTGRGPQELAEALFVVTSAGVRGSEALGLLEQAAKASAIGLGDTKDIARAVTAAVQAYGVENLDAALATDILAATVREGNLEASELAGSLGRVIGIAAQVGVSFADVGAFIATFTRLGVSAEEAVTSLRGTLALMIKPTDEAREALGEVGLTFEQLRGDIQERGLDQALIGLIQRFDGNVESLSKVIPNVRALSGVLGTAAAQGEEFAQIGDNINNALGLVDEGFITTKETAQQQFNEMKAAFDVLVISIGEDVLPMMKDAITLVTSFIAAFQSLPDPIRKVGSELALVGSVTALAGGAFLILLPTLTQGVGQFLALWRASRLFRLSMLGLPAAFLGFLAVTETGRSQIVGFVEDVFREVARLEGLVPLLRDLPGPRRQREADEAIAQLSEATQAAITWGDETTAHMALVQARVSEMDFSDLEKQTIFFSILSRELNEVASQFAPLVDTTGEWRRQLVSLIEDLGLTREEAIALGEAIDEKIIGSDVPDFLMSTAFAFNVVQKEMEELGLVTERELTPMQALMEETSEGITSGLEAIGDALDVLLPKPGQTFQEWRDEAAEFAAAFAGFNDNIQTIFGELEAGNVQMADVIVAKIAEAGPIYTAQIAEFFKDNPQATLEGFQDIAPGLASDWVGQASRIISQQGPGYLRALTEAVINNIENVPLSWRTEFKMDVAGVEADTGRVKTAINSIPTSKHVTISLSTIGPDPITLSILKGQHGFHGVVDRPTLMLVGEGGRPERVDITPGGGGGGDGGGGGATVIFAAGAFEGAFPSFINTASPDDLTVAADFIAQVVRDQVAL